MSLKSVKIPLAFGGESSRGEVDDIYPDEALWMRDFMPSRETGALVGRPGFLQTNVGTSLTQRVVSMFGWRFVGSNGGVVQMADGRVWTLDTTRAPLAQIVAPGALALGAELWAFEGYRNAAGQARLYMLQSTVTTPLVFDGTTVATWTNAPLNCSCLKVWRNRMCVSGSGVFPHRVYYSNVGDPDAPASAYGNNWVDLIDSQTSAFDQIVALAVAGDYLIVLKKQSTWVIYDPVTFNNRRISDVGAVNWASTAQARGRVFWVARPDRLMSTDGVKVRQECPQFQFIPGQEGVGANSDIGRTWMAATDNEMYISQNHWNSFRELLYIPLDEKNARGEMPVFRHMHRRTPNQPVWGFPAETLTGNYQAMQVVTTFPKDQSYSASALSGNTRLFVFGGYSQASSNSGRLWELGASLDGDNIVLATDTAESGVNAYPSYAWWTRLPFKEMESFERLRRLNAYFRGAIRADVFPELNTKYVGWGLGGQTQQPLPTLVGDFTGELAIATGNSRLDWARFRPETRGRSQLIRFSAPAQGNPRIFELEAVYRGGKEH